MTDVTANDAPAAVHPLRKTATDAWTITVRYTSHWVRQPEELLIGLMVPIMLVLVFGYVFGNAMVAPGAAETGGAAEAGPSSSAYREFLMPGMFVMAMLYAIGGTATGVANDIDKGVIDRFRSMPMSRFALLTGRSMADMLRAGVDVTVLIACGLAVGWRWHDGLTNLALAIGVLLLLRLALIWVAIYLALLMPTPDSTSMVVYVLAFPLGALSSMFVAPAMLPGWLGTVAAWNPVSATVTATRELFGNPSMAGDAWASQNALLMAVAWPLVILAATVPLSVRRYRRLSR